MATWKLNDCTPSEAQIKLLQAAVGRDPSAQAAWSSWCQLVDLDDVDPASYRLLPMVYRNLTDQGVSDPVLTRLKGVYRHTWYKNQMLFHHAEQVVALLRAADVPVMLLKGAAMTLHHYADNGIRSMNDIDVMIPQDRFEYAFQILLENGWQTKERLEEARQNIEHQYIPAVGFQKNQFEFDLHYQLLNSTWQEEQAYWKTAIPLTWQGHTVHIMDDTEQLFHICVKGVQWSYAYLSWIPDSLTILQNPDTAIAWDRLLTYAEKTRTIPHMQNALAFLADQFSAPVPASVLQQLSKMKTTFAERQEYKATGLISNTMNHKLRQLIFIGPRYIAFGKGKQAPVRMPIIGWRRYLYVRWQIEHWWQAPIRIMRVVKAQQSKIVNAN